MLILRYLKKQLLVYVVLFYPFTRTGFISASFGLLQVILVAGAGLQQWLLVLLESLFSFAAYVLHLLNPKGELSCYCHRESSWNDTEPMT